MVTPRGKTCGCLGGRSFAFYSARFGFFLVGGGSCDGAFLCFCVCFLVCMYVCCVVGVGLGWLCVYKYNNKRTSEGVEGSWEGLRGREG